MKIQIKIAIILGIIAAMGVYADVKVAQEKHNTLYTDYTKEEISTKLNIMFVQ